jgi:hypothetical protein
MERPLDPAAAGGTFGGGSTVATGTGVAPVGHAAGGGPPGELGGGAGAITTNGERGQPHGAHPRLIQHL